MLFCGGVSLLSGIAQCCDRDYLTIWKCPPFPYEPVHERSLNDKICIWNRRDWWFYSYFYHLLHQEFWQRSAPLYSSPSSVIKDTTKPSVNTLSTETGIVCPSPISLIFLPELRWPSMFHGRFLGLHNTFVWTSHLSTNQKVKRHGKYTAVHVMLSYEYAHVSTNAHPNSVCACAKWMRVLTWLQALQSPKPMSHRERMPGRHMKSTFKCCCNRLEHIIVWIDTVMLILQSVPKAQGSFVCCYDNNQVWVNNVWVKINLEIQYINKTYKIHFVRSRGSHIDVAWRSVCDREQNGIKRSPLFLGADQGIKTNSERLKSTDQRTFSDT